VDCTLGEGGHSELFLSTFPDIKVIAFERDPEILSIAEKRLAKFGDRIEIIHSNFSALPDFLEKRSEPVQYVLFDYGISSFHFDRSGRGFTFRDSEPLDMRLDGNKGPSAADLVNGSSAEELADIFFHYGEERWSRKIAAYIKEQRRKKPFETADELADIVMRAIPRRFHVKNIHPATRVFQALRIAVNNELEAIDRGLDSIYRYLDDGGRIMSMSFHSLEDRIVKNRFRQWARGCSCGLEGKQCQCLSRPFVSMVTKKPVIPTDEEIAENKRSRSARLRVCERIMR
jgi:16S rRNA (cytosine1402-N4)-methyltransferase